MDNILFIFITLAAGFVLPLQSAFNGELRRNTNSPYLSGAINNTIGAIFMVILAFVFRKQFPVQMPVTTTANWWMWLGGVMSAIIVTTSIVSPMKIGFASFVSIFLTGQLIMALIIDNFGLLGANVVPIESRHILGIIFLMVGILLIKR